MRFAEARRTVRPIPIRPAAASAKIHSGSPVNGSRVAATLPPRRVVAPRTPPAGFAFAGLSATTAPLTPPAAAGAAAAGVDAAGADAVAGAAAGATAAAGAADGPDVTCVEMTVGVDEAQSAPVGTDSVFVTVS